MKELKKTENGLGIQETRFRELQVVPRELLNTIDGINTMLNLEPMEESQILLIATFIFSEFQDLTAHEVLDAVYKGNAGKLGTKEECDPTAYGKIDIDYFGRILRGYKQWKINQRQLKQMRDNGQQKQLEMPKPKNYDKECQEWYDWIEEIVKKDKKLPYIASWSMAYEHMIRNNILEIDEEDMEMHKSILVDKVRQEMSELKVMRKNYSHLAKVLQSEESLNHHFKTVTVKNYFEAKLKKDE